MDTFLKSRSFRPEILKSAYTSRFQIFTMSETRTWEETLNASRHPPRALAASAAPLVNGDVS